uniref:mucin-3A isoform X2 n=1 Tax=Ciona intestinalis TaxID=7719 RepID=UPI00089DC9CE|nr:mucin-3A isoform X2 [Ciona intestinalis]|eukprot:XP_018668992.1 mucin-3A isoform X2 [Ciona intestinalis]
MSAKTPDVNCNNTFKCDVNETNRLDDEVFSENEEYDPACMDLLEGKAINEGELDSWLHAPDLCKKDASAVHVNKASFVTKPSNSTYDLGNCSGRKSQVESVNSTKSVCDASFTNSQIDFILAEQAKTQQNSSVSLVDFDEVDDDDFLFSSEAKKINGENILSDNFLDSETNPGLRASPIPLAADMDAYVTNTPPQRRNSPQISSPFQSPIDTRQRPFSISSTTASPIRPGNVIASTPFHGRHFSLPPDGIPNQPAPEAAVHAIEFVVTKPSSNQTFDAGNTAVVCGNSTFTAKPAEPTANTTFNTVPSVSEKETFITDSTFNVANNETVDAEQQSSQRGNATFKTEQPISEVVNTTFNKEQHASTCINTTFNKDQPNLTQINTTFNKEQQASSCINTTFNKEQPKLTHANINTTFNADQPSQTHNNITFNAPTPQQSNTTYSTSNSTFNMGNQQMEVSPINEETFNSPDNVIANSTFNKGPCPNSNDKDRTFDVGTSHDVQMNSQSPSSESTNADSSKELESETMNCSKQSITSKSKLRKPLSSVGNSSESGIKSGIPMKRSSRLVAPRMNTAAISRIQARSPQKTAQSTNVDENATTLMKPPTSTTSLRKPQPRKSIAVPRKSLLPPGQTKSRLSTAPAPHHTRVNKPSPPKPSDPPTDNPRTPSKRKAESPKHAGRAAKFEGPRNEATSTRPGHTSSLRHSGVVTSRIASLTNRPSNKRPQASTSSTRASISSAHSTPQPSIPNSNVAKTRSSTTKPVTKTTKRVPKKKPVSNTSQCAVAMATLLDYVINKLDGLSAPQLASDKQQLSRLVSEQSQTNTDLATRVSELEASLTQSREAHHRDVTEATERHLSDVTALEQKHETELTKVKNQVNDLTQKVEQEKDEHEQVVTAMRDVHSKAISALENSHSAALEELRLEWAQERNDIEQETADLRERMDEKVQEKVQELVQPYITAHEDNKSLRAVLEMKNAEQHKLQIEMSQQSDQHTELRALRDQVIALQQKNEDLQTQVHDKNAEQRLMKKELDQLRQTMDEQHHSMKNQQQRIEELNYRLTSPNTSPASPFNPVFTQSPTANQTPDLGNPFGSSRRKTSDRTHSSLTAVQNDHRSPIITTTPQKEVRT